MGLKAEPFSLRTCGCWTGRFAARWSWIGGICCRSIRDRLLHVFRLAAEVPSTARPYGGWMAPEHLSRGDFVGHYMSAFA